MNLQRNIQATHSVVAVWMNKRLGGWAVVLACAGEIHLFAYVMLILFPVIMACDVDLESLSLEWYTQACESCHDRGWTPVGCLDLESRSLRDMAVEIPRDRQGRAHVHIVLLSLGPRIGWSMKFIQFLHTQSQTCKLLALSAFYMWFCVPLTPGFVFRVSLLRNILSWSLSIVQRRSESV